jgi:Phosphodiester glycosidase
LTARGDKKLNNLEEHRRPSRPGGSRPSRRRYWVRRAGVVLVVLLLWLAWSIGGVLTAPGTDSTAARLAEWARFNGLGWVVSDLEQIQYQMNPPKVGGSLAGGIPIVAPARLKSRLLVAPAPIPPQAQPPLRDEGVWQPLISVHGKPAALAAFLRPDAQHTSYLVGVAWLDQRLVKLVLHPGFRVPGDSGLSQPSQVPVSQRDSLLATFNSGFTMMDANGGYWQGGKTAVPLRSGAASMVFYKDGHVDVVKWSAAAPGPDVAAVRQNLGMLVDHGTISPDVNSTTTRTWGKTVGNPTFVWRSALGIRKDGTLVFVVGASMSVHTLANIVHDAGAVRAMELDINKAWTNFITYSHPSKGVAVPHMLTKDEHPNPYRYLQPSSRDFVAVLSRG